MSSCILKPCVEKDGKFVESKLFNDINNYVGKRSEAKIYYEVAKDERFLSQIDNAEFDENGEITFKSFKRALNLEEGPIVDKLNKDLKSGTYPYDEAVTKIQVFNRDNPFNNKFMAILEPDGMNYKISVVKKTKANERKLEKTIEQQTLQNQIIYSLKKHGVSVKFLEEGNKSNSRYSTVNVEKTIDGFYSLIDIAHGVDVTDALCHEAGHFAIGALGENQLVERLIGLLDDKTIEEVLGESYDSKVTSASPSREAAGILVGKALKYNYTSNGIIGKLASRISNIAKKIFYTFKRDEAKINKIKAERIAEKIARGFMSTNFEGTIDNAINYPEVLFDAKTSVNVSTYRKIVATLGNLAIELRNIANDSLSEQVSSDLKSVVSGKGALFSMPSGRLQNVLALQGIAEAVYAIQDLMGYNKEVFELLDSIDFSNDETFDEKTIENAVKLRKVRAFLLHANQVSEIITKVVNSDRSLNIGDNKYLIGDIGNITLEYGGREGYTVNLVNIKNNLNKGLHYIQDRMQTKESEFFCKFLTNIYGKKYITISSRRLFKDGKCVPEVGKEMKSEDFIRERLISLEEDSTVLDRFLSSMSNSNDVIGQLCDKAVKYTNKTADDATMQIFDRLRVLKAKLDDYNKNSDDKITTASFFELDENNKLTGNLKSSLYWGKWEEERHQFIENLKKRFKENTKNQSLDPIMREFEWGTFFHDNMKKWNEDHSVYVEESYTNFRGEQIDAGHWIPNDDYINTDFEAEFPSGSAKRIIYNEYMEIKKDIDRMLPPGSTMSVRAPQIRGTFSNRLRNMRLYDGGAKSFFKTLRNSLIDKFCENAADTDYGSEQTYNSEEEMLFFNAWDYEKEKLNRLPLFGINKLRRYGKKTAKDSSGNTIRDSYGNKVKEEYSTMDDLSTDLFHSTLAYASMTFSYAAMSNIVDTLEVGRNVLLDRKPGSEYSPITEAKDKKGFSNTYKRYDKYLEKQVYGISMPKVKFGKKFVLNKAIAIQNKLMAWLFIAGNVQGGLINLGTGLIELNKEALTGEFFNYSDLIKAHADYFNMVFGLNFGIDKDWEKHLGTELKGKVKNMFSDTENNTRLALLITHFNVLQENRRQFENWNTTKTGLKKLGTIIDEVAFAPYHLSDHMMQCLGYLAFSNHTKLYSGKKDADGNYIPTSILDAYDIISDKITTANGEKEAGRYVVLKGRYYKSIEALEKAPFLEDILREAERVNSVIKAGGSITLASMDLTDEQRQYIIEQGYDERNLDNLIFNLKKDIKSLEWTEDDEVEFMMKSREISNRLHGIYNKQDSVVLSQHWFGNAFLGLKGWAVGKIQGYFLGDRYNISLGKNVEGKFDTFVKVLYPILAGIVDADFGLKHTAQENMLKNRGLDYARLMLPVLSDWTDKIVLKAKGKKYVSSADNTFEKYGYSNHQYRNMRRMNYTALVIGLLMLLRTLTKKDDDDDDEKSSLFLGHAYYIFNRLYREQMALDHPKGLTYEAGTLLSLFYPGMEATKELFGLFHQAVGYATVKDTSNSEFYYQKSKKGFYEKGDPKIKAKLRKDTPYWKSTVWLLNPYEASKSYDYGKNTKR